MGGKQDIALNLTAMHCSLDGGDLGVDHGARPKSNLWKVSGS